MRFPKLQEITRYRDMTTVFGGYNHQISCLEGQFFDMKNMTSNYFPILSPRQNRGIVKTFTNPQGILDKEDIWLVDDKKLYKNGIEQILHSVSLSSVSPKTLVKMGAYIVIMPDKIWVNTKSSNENLECGYLENKFIADDVTISTCNESGDVIKWHDSDYYKDHTPEDGNYMMSINTSGKYSLKVYSATTGIWMTVASTYVQIKATGIGECFEKEDGIKISAVLDTEQKKKFSNIFVNDEGNDLYSTNTYIVDKTDDYITIPGIYNYSTDSGSDPYENFRMEFERSVPDMAFITECNNRLWGCSKDGHEIYCSKLGDMRNWNCFRGVSTDSWAATVGSDGKFTGAITYLGYPMFFKEDCIIKIAVSATGGHQVKETRGRGVQKGSYRSLAILNEMLYYKAVTGICAYNGSLPYSISDEFGDIQYYDAVSGAINDKYYVSMKDSEGNYSMFAYDSKNGIWNKEDDTNAILFCSYRNELYFIDGTDNTMKSVGGTLLPELQDGTTEDKFDWFVESGAIGYSSPDNKYVGRINLRITLEFGTNVDFFIQYDSSGEWEHKFNMSGTGTRTYSIPIIPKRCDHFKFKISGTGNCKIHSVTKAVEEGSAG